MHALLTFETPVATEAELVERYGSHEVPTIFSDTGMLPFGKLVALENELCVVDQDERSDPHTRVVYLATMLRRHGLLAEVDSLAWNIPEPKSET